MRVVPEDPFSLSSLHCLLSTVGQPWEALGEEWTCCAYGDSYLEAVSIRLQRNPIQDHLQPQI